MFVGVLLVVGCYYTDDDLCGVWWWWGGFASVVSDSTPDCVYYIQFLRWCEVFYLWYFVLWLFRESSFLYSISISFCSVLSRGVGSLSFRVPYMRISAATSRPFGDWGRCCCCCGASHRHHTTDVCCIVRLCGRDCWFSWLASRVFHHLPFVE